MRVLVNLTRSEESYQGYLRAELSSLGHKAKVSYKTYQISELLATAKRIGADVIYCTNPQTLANCLPDGNQDQTAWRGSVLFMSTPVVIGQPLSYIRKTVTGKLLFQIDTRKIAGTKQGAYIYDFTIPKDRAGLGRVKPKLARAAMLVIDIETSLLNKITSISFTEITDSYEVGSTFVISLLPAHWREIEDCYEAWELVKALCESPTPKVFHNGCFDCFHLLRFNIIPANYLYDTEYIWRCWYAELPKSLARIASYILPDYYYWKHEADLAPLEYNAKDTINTARIIIELIRKAPDWVWKNYSQFCPNIAPVLYTAFEGFLTDTKLRAKAGEKAKQKLATYLGELRRFIGSENFNPGSWQQVHALIYGVLGAKIPSRAKSAAATGETELKAVALQHPLFDLFTSRIIKYRELKKAIGTYYEARLDPGSRLLYSLQLDGTETGRMACSSSSLYAPPLPGKSLTKTGAKNLGTQLQNIPPYLKTAMLADPGYLLIDTDKSQSEARCTAYLAGSESLRVALESTPTVAGGIRDFYCYTGYKFFGIEFDMEHPLRKAVKAIIHGTNYLMGALALIDIVGITQMQEYQKLVGYKGSLQSFALYLLSLYHIPYPEVKRGWDATVKEVALTGKIVTPDGWTRKVLGDIVASHAVMRACVAHKSQHFSVVGINEAFWKLFFYLQVGSKGEYRLKGQIHDSIVAQAKEERSGYYARKQEEIMDIPQQTPFGEMRIPLETSVSYYWKE